MPFYIRKLEIENFLRVVTFNVDPDGKHVIIDGRNGEGKTSIVEGIFEALAGSNSKERPEPVHKGAAKALIRLDLGDYLVEKHINADGKSRLVVKAADGSKINSPQKLLDGLLSAYSLDPVAFLDRRPQDQLDDVLKVCGIVPPVNQVEKITGEATPARAGESADQYMERLSADETGLWYIRRREQHRVVETNRGAVEKQESLVTTLATASPDVGQLRDAGAITADIQAAMALQKEWDAANAVVNGLVNEQAGLSQTFQEVQGQQTSLESAIAEAQSDIEVHRKAIRDLEALVAGKQEELSTVEARLDKGRQLRVQVDAEIDQARQALADKQDQTQRMKALGDELAKSQSMQETIIKHNQAVSRLEELSAEHEAGKREHLRIDEVLAALRDLRKSLLEGVDLGVDGLEVGNGELRLHGVSFKQASLAQKLRVACAVAMKGNGQLRLLRVDNGEHLDSESRAYLLELANKHNFQVIMTCVSDRDKIGVEIIDPETTVEPVKTNLKPASGKLFETVRDAAAV